MKNLLTYCKPYRINIFLNIVFNLFSTIFSIFSFLMLIPFLNLIFHAEDIKPITEKVSFSIFHLKDFFEANFNNTILSIIQQYGKANALLFICGLTVTVFFIKNIFRYFAVHFLAPMRTGIASNCMIKF